MYGGSIPEGFVLFSLNAEPTQAEQTLAFAEEITNTIGPSLDALPYDKALVAVIAGIASGLRGDLSFPAPEACDIHTYAIATTIAAIIRLA